MLHYESLDSQSLLQYVLPFLLVSLVGGRVFSAMHFMIPLIILSVSSSERVAPFELPLLSPLSVGSFGGSYGGGSLGFDAIVDRLELRSGEIQNCKSFRHLLYEHMAVNDQHACALDLHTD